MIGALKRTWDNFRGSGESAVTVPPMDGALRPNRLLEEARLAAAVAAPDDLAVADGALIASSGRRLLRLDGTEAVEIDAFDADITAIAASPTGRIAVALAAGRIEIVGTGERRSLDRLGDEPARCITAMTFLTEIELVVAQGSSHRAAHEWKRDLMERRADGSIRLVDLGSGSVEQIAGNLGWPLGIATQGGHLLVSESWRHRVVRLVKGGAPEPVLSDLPGYPARIHSDGASGYWLAVFAPRNQIIEFVQREPAFLARMIEEVEEAYWAAPSLKPSATFLEPLQGGAQKHLGMLKPWAPTRSYGLVVHLNAQLRPTASFHSRADGIRHGVTTALPLGGTVFAAAKGGDAIVALEANGVGGMGG